MKKPCRIAFISTMMPTPTNVGGPSSLPYQLIAHRPEGIDVVVYTLNQNHIDGNKLTEYARQMRCSVTVVHASLRYRLCNTLGLRWIVYRFHSMPFQTLISLPADDVEKINTNHDIAWLYPHYLLGIGRQIGLPMIVTGPDSSALHYERCLYDKYALMQFGQKCIIKMRQHSLRLESSWASLPNTQLHFVGNADCQYFLSNNPQGRGFFLRHPSNMPAYLCPKTYGDQRRRLRLLITGKLNVYTLSDMDIVVNELCLHAQPLCEEYLLTFVGNGWGDVADTLRQHGYEAACKTWVADYFEELKQHDLQLFPISVGTGTKGKVLDALCAGIVCVGSRYAFENIALQESLSAYCYDDAHQIGDILQRIYEQQEKLSAVAAAGHDMVLAQHSPTDLASEFFKHFEQ